MPRYYKGNSKVDSQHLVVFKLYDEMQNSKFGLVRDYIVEVEYIDHSGINKYASFAECLKDYYVRREISEEEYNMYLTIQTLITELYMNNITGGFPRKATVVSSAKRILHDAPKLCDILIDDAMDWKMLEIAYESKREEE